MGVHDSETPVRTNHTNICPWGILVVNATSVINLHTYFTQWYKNKANQ
jgi:hypothetical protein